MPFIRIEDLMEVEVVPGFTGSFLHSENLTIATWEIEAGSSLPEHSHQQEQISIVTEGEFELTLAGETMVLAPGLVAVVPSTASHSGKALTDCSIVDVFYPVRDDYKFDE